MTLDAAPGIRSIGGSVVPKEMLCFLLACVFLVSTAPRQLSGPQCKRFKKHFNLNFVIFYLCVVCSDQKTEAKIAKVVLLFSFSVSGNHPFLSQHLTAASSNFVVWFLAVLKFTRSNWQTETRNDCCVHQLCCFSIKPCQSNCKN